jgi:sigma-E factor negative regulatory protein RseB
MQARFSSLIEHRVKSLSVSAALLAIAVAAPAVLGQDSAAEAERWLDRMNAAIESVNYRGTLIHVIDGNAEELQIVHRFEDGAVTERITSSGDSGSELLWTEGSVRSVFPHEKLVVVEEHGSSIPVAPSVSYAAGLDDYYQITSFEKGNVADRDTHIVSIRARDKYRYGYLLFLDQETALPLKIEVRDDGGRVVIESILFTEIEILDSIPEYAFTSSVNAEGFTWKRPIPADYDDADTELWGVTRLPNGFTLAFSGPSWLAGSRYPVQHLVYTDGLATVSVFVAHPKSDDEMPAGPSRSGSTNAYSLIVDGRLVTAMGDVPRRTVQRIATSLDAQ